MLPCRPAAVSVCLFAALRFSVPVPRPGGRRLRPVALLAWLLLAFLLSAPGAFALTASAVQWQSYNGSPGPLAASSFSTAAPNVYDGAVGDTSTGYSLSGGGTLCVLWDMGSSVSLSGVRAQFANASYSATAYSSTDGSSWTSCASLTSGTQQSFSPTTARYLQLIFCGSGSSPSVTDARLYDGGGTLVSGPNSAPDFSLSAAASSQSIAPGQSGSPDTLTVASLNGFSAGVTLAASCSQAGVTGSISPASATPAANGSTTSALTISVATGTAPGTYPLTVTGTSGSLSHAATVSVTVLGPPAAPTSLTAQGGNQQVNLSWTAPAGSGLTYSVFRGTSAGGESGTPVATGLTSTSYTNTGLTNGQAYFFTVKATNSLGTGPASGEASATPAPALTALAVTWQYASNPNPQVASSFSTNAHNIYDGSVGDTATGYGGSGSMLCVLYDLGSSVSVSAVRAQFTGAGYVQSAYTSPDGSAWTQAASLSSGSAQTFSPVTARYVQFVFAGSGPNVTDARVYDGGGTLILGPGSTPPAAPTNLAATGGNQFVSLSWTAPSGTGLTYSVYRGTSAGGESGTALATGLTAAGYTDSSVSNGTAHFYTVKAVNAAGAGAASNEASATPQAVTPLAPAGLSGSPGNQLVILSWTASAGPNVTYSVFRGTASGGEGTTAIISGLTGTGYTDQGLTNGTPYFYTVKAVNAIGSSPASAEATATPQPLPPAVPTNLSAQGGDGQATVSWTASPGAASYTVTRATASGGPYSPVGTGGTGTSYTDPGLTNGTTYYYEVSALNSGGTSSPAGPVSAVPVGPLYLTATASSNQVNLSWNSSSGANSFNIYRSTTPGGEGSASIAPSGYYYTSYTDTSATAGVTYYYTVAGVTNGSVGASSNEASATPGSSPLPQPNLVKAQAGNAQVTLTWQPVSGATSYALYRTFGSNGTPALYRAGLTATAFTDAGLTNQTTYYYQVAAASVNGLGSLSGTVSATPGSTPLPPPTLAATPGNGQVTLNWTRVTNASSYNIYRSTTPGGEGSLPVVVNVYGGSNTYNDPSLTNGTHYYYQVAPVSQDGEGTLSNEASAVPGSTPLANPTNFTATADPTGLASIALNWTAVAGAASYTVYRDGVLCQQNIAGTSYTDTNVVCGPTYTYIVIAVDNNGSSLSNAVSATLVGFTITASPTLVTASSGTVQAVNITLVPTGGLTGPVALSGTNLPSGVTAWFYPASVTLPVVNTPEYQAGQPSEGIKGAVSSGLYLGVSSGAPAGTFTLHVTGTSSVIANGVHSIDVTVTIN